MWGWNIRLYENNGFPPEKNNWHRIVVRGTDTELYVDYYDTVADIHREVTNPLNYFSWDPASNYKIHLRNHHWGTGTGGDRYETDEWDWIAVRKYVDPEPSHGAWGSEEEFMPVSANQDLLVNAISVREASYERDINHPVNVLGVASRLGGFSRTITQIVQFVFSAFRSLSMFRGTNQQLRILAYGSRYALCLRTVSQSLYMLSESISSRLFGRSASQALTVLIDSSRQTSLLRTVPHPLRVLATVIRQASYHRSTSLILRIQTLYALKFIIYIEKPVPSPAPAPPTPVLPSIRLDAIIQTAHLVSAWWIRTFTVEVLVINKGLVASDIKFEYLLLDSEGQIIAKGTQTVFVSGLDKKPVYIQIPKPPDGNYTMTVRIIEPVEVEAKSTITVETPFYGTPYFATLVFISIAVAVYIIKKKI